jgi:hypothetical protein
MLLEIKSGEMPTSRGMAGVYFELETDDVTEVGGPDRDGCYTVKMKNGKDYQIADTALPRSQFLAAWKGAVR